MTIKRSIYAHSTLLLFMVGALSAQYQEDSALFTGTYSENYINRWGIQAIADHVFDPRTGQWFLWPTKDGGVTFDPADVKPGDIVFARDLDAYFKKLHPKIKHPYILVTGGEQRDAVTEKSMRMLDEPTIIAWFSVHASAIAHPKFHMLPLGIYQDKKFYEPRAELTKQFAQWRNAPKKGLLYSNYGDIKGGKPERGVVDSIFDDAEFCYKAKRLPFLEYMEEMSHYKFTLSPPGYGPDCYRHWEALLVGSIPIIRSSHMDPLYADLPMLIIEDWHEVTEEFLEKKYREMTAKKFIIEKLFMEYWWKKIRAVQAEFRAQENSDDTDSLFFNEGGDNFVIRWAFQDFCDHVFDPRVDKYRWPTDRSKGVTFNPADVEPGDVIFVRCIDKFFKEMHPLIQHPYIIVTHGECLEAIQKNHLSYMDEEKVIAWFGIHAYEKSHPKFSSIPIGILQEPAHYKKKKQMNEFFKELRHEMKKEHLVYMNFAAQDEKPERQMLRKKFIDKPYCKRGARVPFKDYMKEMASCKFAFSPPGLGCDCYRTWEALFAGCIPIVRSSQLNELYKDLPILVIDRWDDINEEFLLAEYKRITSMKYDIRKLYMEYWIEKINGVRNRFKAERGV